MNTYRAHIFKERNVGEREEVKLKIFGPDGSPLDLGGGGGGSVESTYYSGYANMDFDPGIPKNSPNPVIIPFIVDDWTYQSGDINIENGDLTIPAPAGLYLVKIQAYWAWTTYPALPEDGQAGVSMNFMYDDPENPGFETSAYFSGVTVSSLHDDEGYGDYQWKGAGDWYKVWIGMAPDDGYFQLSAEQNAFDDPMRMNHDVVIVKL